MLSLPILNPHVFHQFSLQKAVEGVKLITTSLLQKLGDIELPEVTDSSEDEEITFTLNRSMLEMLKNLQSEITESEKQAASPGRKIGKPD
uniref:hypothetical protein n=1 Tax=Escherichia coli TaxID=562 RepID=UPI001F285A34|nr:hypothetical protein [Escherichia coli]